MLPPHISGCCGQAATRRTVGVARPAAEAENGRDGEARPNSAQDLWRCDLCHVVSSLDAPSEAYYEVGATGYGVEMCYLGAKGCGADLLSPKIQFVSLRVYM